MIKTSKGFTRLVNFGEARSAVLGTSSKSTTGFTVLEFLIIITIMGILIAIVLVSLSASRARARDDERLARVQNAAVAIEQFYTDCRTYPLELSTGYVCPTPGNQNITLGNYISELGWWADSTSGYSYQPLSYGGNIEPCTGYHIGVLLENTGNAFAIRDAQFDSTAVGVDSCTTDGIGYSSISNPFDGTALGVYDLKR